MLTPTNSDFSDGKTLSETDLSPIQDMVAPLIAWYRQTKRSLPWRDAASAYPVWVSEIMLQQTRIEAVIPYYLRFIESFPDIASLAAADEDELLKLWQGLGYYSRVRNLKKAAVQICRDFHGELPKTASELKKLSGIGDYTAGAIASIAYGQPEPAVDGNVLRVCMRLLACHDDITLPETKTKLTSVLRSVYPSGDDAAALTQGLMELGEVVCIPNGTPDCTHCPLSHLCRANQDDIMTLLPIRSGKKARRIERRTVFLLCCDGSYAICQRPDTGLLSKLWEFPNRAEWLSEKDVTAIFPDCTAIRREEPSKHIFTHIEWHMIGYTVTLPRKTDGYLWKTPAEILDRYAVPTAFHTYLSILKRIRANGENKHD